MFGNCRLANIAAKSAGRSPFSPAGSEFASGKSAIEENRQIKAKIEKPLTYAYLRFAY